MYGMHPREIYELRNLGKEEMRSADVEDFVAAMQSLSEYLKKKVSRQQC